MPLFDDYRDQLKSDIADMMNTGGRPAGSITAAMFLKEFTGGLPWAHLDIAGTAWAEEAKPYLPKGPSGVAVRTLAELAFDKRRSLVIAAAVPPIIVKLDRAATRSDRDCRRDPRRARPHRRDRARRRTLGLIIGALMFWFRSSGLRDLHHGDAKDTRSTSSP